MAAIRDEARDAAREPDGGTPGRSFGTMGYYSFTSMFRGGASGTTKAKSGYSTICRIPSCNRLLNSLHKCLADSECKYRRNRIANLTERRIHGSSKLESIGK